MNLETLRLVPRLGYRNAARVAIHRLKARSGWYALRQRGAGARATPSGPLFRDHLPAAAGSDDATGHPSRIAAELLAGHFRAFGGAAVDVGSPPDWFRSVLTGRRMERVGGHWSSVEHFPAGIGDIKGIWELSRFGWAPILARAATRSRNAACLAALNDWTADWLAANPPYRGPNWACGQETSLRLLHLLAAARILAQDGSPTPRLLAAVAAHGERIRATLPYAASQDNNHAISEAAGLYVCGAWLAAAGGATRTGSRRARGWEHEGRRRLIAGVGRLVAGDGSFAQHSVNYHRMVVDILAEVETWRGRLHRPPFPAPYRQRVVDAVRWLESFTDPISGDAPNVGANDGAQVLASTASTFRDYGCSVAAARAVFGLERAEAGAVLFPEGGYARLVPPGAGSAWAMVRIPRYAFRPGDSDPLHLDLWHGGRNLLRDGGTYGYHPEASSIRAELAGPAGHNTVQFDGRDPMPLVGRFLRSSWIDDVQAGPIESTHSAVRWMGAYRDARGAGHRRTVIATDAFWEVVDEVRDYADRAVLRWRLEPGDWRLDGTGCAGPSARLEVSASTPLRRLELVESRESRHYGELTSLPVLEAEVAPGVDVAFTTRIAMDRTAA